MHEAVLVIDLARSLFATIDRAIYSLIAAIYSIILEISRISFFSSEDISAMSKRIYVFIGVFMLFKVTFSLISYLVNPDNISDKNNGLGNVSKNVIVTLFLIIIVPYAFDLLYSAQNAILKDNLIPRVVLGTDGKGNNSGAQTVVMDKKICSIDGDHATVEEDGQLLALLTFRPFFQVYDDTKDKIDSNAKKEYCTSNSVSNLLSSNLYNDETAILNTGQYIIDYQFLLSTITGVVVFLLLLNFAFDIAARTIKLGFLEIIAPIPILSYIDPKSSKDGPFKKWLSEVGKTWASLFIRLAIVYFSIYAIKLVSESFDRISDEHTMWITLFLIIGILIFAKNAIPLIENIFGIKFDHDVQLNPFKKISEQAAGGKQLLGASAATLAAGVGVASFAGKKIADEIKNGKNKRVDDAEKRLALAKARLEKNPSQRNQDRVTRRQVALDRANLKKADSDVRKAKVEEFKANAMDKLHIEEIKASKVASAGKTIMQGVTQMKDAAVEGYKEGSNMKFNPIDIGTKSAKTRDYKQQYGPLDRAKDTATDFFGIKNESGTTSEVKKRIEELTQQLERIKRNEKDAARGLSDLRTKLGASNFEKLVSSTPDGRYVFNDSAIIEGVTEQLRNDVKASVNTVNRYEEERLATQKELNKQEKIRDKKPGDGK